MYAVEADVRALVANKVSQTTGTDIAARGAIVDRTIDMILASAFYWPKDINGATISPTPAPVVQSANYLTAALIERQAYFGNVSSDDTGGTSYINWLEASGRQILDDLVEGRRHDTALVRPTLVSAASSAQPDGFNASSNGVGRRYRPVSGLRGGGRKR